MGGKRKLKGSNPPYLFKPLPEPSGFRSAYQSKEGPPLIRRPNRRCLSVRIQREVGRLHSAMGDFFKIFNIKTTSKQSSASAQKENMEMGTKGVTKYNTDYDLHRDEKYWTQTRLLESSYSRFFDRAASTFEKEGKTTECLTVLDIGCGTGKLMRRIVRNPMNLLKLESGNMRMRMLGIDFNQNALAAAVAKKGILFCPTRHPNLAGNLEMEFLMLDLLDLKRLDLSKTCIGEKKVDIVLATDVFRWIRAKERLELLQAVISKLKPTGYLVSMEFTYPPLPPEPHISRNLVIRLGSFNFLEPMQLGDLYTMAEAVGFRRVQDSKIDRFNSEQDPFPPLVSIVFAPGKLLKKKP